MKMLADLCELRVGDLVTDDNMGNEWQQISIRTFVHGTFSMLRNLWRHLF